MRRRLSALGAIALLTGCRAVWSLGDAPSELDPEDGGPGSGSGGSGAAPATGSGSTGTSADASTGAITGPGGASSGGGGDTGAGGGGAGAGPCGLCESNDDCGALAGEGRCGVDGRCDRSAWPLSDDARGVADHFAVTPGRVAIVVDEGGLDTVEDPRRDNRLAVLDRASGEIATFELATTSLGSIAMGPDGTIAYAPRIPDGGGVTQLVVVDADGTATPWPGAPSDLVLRGLRWDGDAPGGGAFFALGDGDGGDRFIRFGAGTFDPCDASVDGLPAGRSWASRSPSIRVFVSDEDASTHAFSTLLLDADGCEPAEPTSIAVDGGITARPVAIAAGDGFTAAILDSMTSRRLQIVNDAGDVVFDEASPEGHALAAGPRGLYAMRDDRLSRFAPSSPSEVEPLAAFEASDAVIDIVLDGEAVLAVAIDSNDEARLLCGLDR